MRAAVAPTMQSPPDTPTKAFPIIQIDLSQSENQFYHPGGLVSGNVHYAHPQEVDNFELTMTFYGVNRTFISTSEKKPFQEAVLFRYETSLHNGAAPRNRSGQQHLATMDFYFKWRFPSVAENRQFSQCYGAVGGHIWENSRHALPPSFNGNVPSDHAETGMKRCSVEYALEAKLCYNKTLITTKRLPIVFLPSRTPSVDPRSNITFNYSPALNIGNEKHDGLFEEKSNGLRVQCPEKIVQGQPFHVSIFAAFEPSTLPEDFVSRLLNMEITKLVMICTTSVRAVGGQSGHNLPPTSQEERSSMRRQIQPASLLSAPRARQNADGTHELEFVFQASMPSYYHSTFRTFLIANNYQFESPMEVRIGEGTIKLPILAPEFVVLSCYASPNTKRPALMPSSFPPGATAGFCIDALARPDRHCSRV
ncbi:hypothetical protein EG328_008196 [Venturia inaequalis]|uniref:Arrestin-like N-terminal domain-containing protein n=1 Tax=Venturia inaequalis TaxID=5025 RepID=A0A8H3VUW4_VENIN|nr:hypothetical protein EG328_008196 [Venturia inaequalis]KAE9993229.1 hypothetical protein EG327_006030 [Venturia inaequalis]